MPTDTYWERIHPILADAMRAAKEADWPEAVHRGRGPVPQLALATAGRDGLYVKLKTRWQWIEGARDEVLVSVPDAHFERAVRALS